MVLVIKGIRLTIRLQSEPLRDGSVLPRLFRELLLDLEGLLGGLAGNMVSVGTPDFATTWNDGGERAEKDEMIRHGS